MGRPPEWGSPLHEASGPDGYAEAKYGKLPTRIVRMADLVNPLDQTEMMPKRLGRAFPVLLVKPRKDPHKVDSRRPLTPPCTLGKLAGSVVYHRLLPAQFPYERERGAEM